MTSTSDHKQQPVVAGKYSSSLPKIKTPIEASTVLDDSDLALMAKIKTEFGSQLDDLYPFVLQNFITGYRHCGDLRESETKSRLAHYLKRAKEYNFKGCLDEELPNEQKMFEAWRVYIYGWDEWGHPVLYDEIGCGSIKAVQEAFGDNIEIVRKYRFRVHRRLLNCKRIQAERYNVTLYKHVMVMDMAEFSASHFNSQYRTIVKDIIGDEQNLFPETLLKLYVVNAPWPFRMLWSVICTFVDPLTAKKISVSKNTSELLDEINNEQIPVRYGGKGKKKVLYGRCADFPDGKYYITKSNESNIKKDESGIKYDTLNPVSTTNSTSNSTPLSSSSTNNNGSIA